MFLFFTKKNIKTKDSNIHRESIETQKKFETQNRNFKGGSSIYLLLILFYFYFSFEVIIQIFFLKKREENGEESFLVVDPPTPQATEVVTVEEQ